MNDLLGGLIALAIVVVVHLTISLLQFQRWPRSVVLSFLGGVPVAYVFLQLIPLLGQFQQENLSALVWLRDWPHPVLQQMPFLCALLGLLIFFGLDRLAQRSIQDRSGHEKASGGVLATNIAVYSLYNLGVGYLLIYRSLDPDSALWPYAIALACHVATNDYSLTYTHKRDYSNLVRFALAGALMLGGLIGWLYPLREQLFVLLSSFASGVFLMNALREELPKGRHGSFTAFALGCAFAAAMLVLFRFG